MVRVGEVSVYRLIGDQCARRDQDKSTSLHLGPWVLASASVRRQRSPSVVDFNQLKDCSHFPRATPQTRLLASYAPHLLLLTALLHAALRACKLSQPDWKIHCEARAADGSDQHSTFSIYFRACVGNCRISKRAHISVANSNRLTFFHARKSVKTEGLSTCRRKCLSTWANQVSFARERSGLLQAPWQADFSFAAGDVWKRTANSKERRKW